MMTGDEYRASLNDGRETYFEGERVENVAEDPILGITVDSAASSSPSARIVIENSDGSTTVVPDEDVKADSPPGYICPAGARCKARTGVDRDLRWTKGRR